MKLRFKFEKLLSQLSLFISPFLTIISIFPVCVKLGAYLSSIVQAMVILTLFYAMNLVGTKSAALLNKIMSFALFGRSGLFIVFGLQKVDPGIYVINTNRKLVTDFFKRIPIDSGDRSGSCLSALDGLERMKKAYSKYVK
ncbi:MAG: hypothetical protein V8R61_02390 [Enterocloster sp.]